MTFEHSGPIMFAEDLQPGMAFDLGAYTVTREEIVEFAKQWDPQVFHIDEDAAKQGFFGGLVASGVQTFAIFQRLAVLGAYRDWAIIAGRTIRDIQLTAPVRPGMTLHGSVTIESVGGSHPTRALVGKRGALIADDETRVMTLFVDGYVRRRPPPQ